MHIITWKKLILRSYILSDSNCIVTERCRVGMFGAQKPVNRQGWWKVCFASADAISPWNTLDQPGLDLSSLEPRRFPRGASWHFHAQY